MSENILVIRGGAIGDFILTLPVLAALRSRFRDCRLEILGYPKIAALAVGAGLADDVQPIESPRFTGFFAPGGSWPAEASAWFLKFGLIISYLHDPEGVFRANVGRACPAKFIAGPHRPDESLGIHATEQLLRPLEELGIRGAKSEPRLSWPSSVSPRLAVHPGSGSEKKNWPEEKWAELLGRVEGNILLIGGEAEGDRCARLGAELPAERVEMAQNVPMLDLAWRMASCSAFAGHDSGITHLAAALNLPGLALWGESDLATWQPRSRRMKIVRDPAGLKALPVETVWQQLQPLLKG